MSENLDKLKKKIAEFDVRMNEREQISDRCRELVNELTESLNKSDMSEVDKLKCVELVHSFHFDLVSKIYE